MEAYDNLGGQVTDSVAEDMSATPIGRETQRACELYKMTDQAGLRLGGFESLSIPCFDLPNQICLKSK